MHFDSFGVLIVGKGCHRVSAWVQMTNGPQSMRSSWTLRQLVSESNLAPSFFRLLWKGWQGGGGGYPSPVSRAAPGWERARCRERLEAMDRAGPLHLFEPNLHVERHRFPRRPTGGGWGRLRAGQYFRRHFSCALSGGRWGTRFGDQGLRDEAVGNGGGGGSRGRGCELRALKAQFDGAELFQLLCGRA